jgi:hypothetical protein
VLKGTRTRRNPSWGLRESVNLLWRRCHTPEQTNQVGCFYLSAGHQALGTFATHLVEVAVDATGAEVFKVDGHVVVEMHGTPTSTNLPFVKAGGVAGYSICKGEAGRYSGCPSSITIFSRDPDKVVLFVVSECLPPKYSLCVTTQENWDYEKARLH